MWSYRQLNHPVQATRRTLSPFFFHVQDNSSTNIYPSLHLFRILFFSSRHLRDPRTTFNIIHLSSSTVASSPLSTIYLLISTSLHLYGQDRTGLDRTLTTITTMLDGMGIRTETGPLDGWTCIPPFPPACRTSGFPDQNLIKFRCHGMDTHLNAFGWEEWEKGMEGWMDGG